MRCGLRPHDRDRTTYSMEESLVGFGLFRERFLLLHTNGHCGCPVNRWSTERPPMERNLTGGLRVVY